MQPSLYRRVLGQAYETMPGAWQALHDSGTSSWHGRCTVDGGETASARLLAWLFRLPAEASDAPIVVSFEVSRESETWTRRIGARAMRSQQFAGPRPGSITEQFGVLAFDLDLPIRDERMDLVIAGGRCLGAPLPRLLLPRVRACEFVVVGRFCFDVSIALPIVGRLVRYRGWLTSR